jgi:cell wall-associated NlpC family hydrolase
VPKVKDLAEPPIKVLVGSTIRILSALILALFAMAVPAWGSDFGSDYNGGGAWDTSDPGWTPQQQPSYPQQPSDPQQTGGTSGSDPGSQPWAPGQGDTQETPGTWTRTPPVQDPSSGSDWPVVAPLPISGTPTVAGRTAMLRRNGLAAIPRSAPRAVKAIIAAANQIIGKPYKWGGGHGRLFDSGYDCSGSVSYALIRAGILPYPMVSGTFARWGVNGIGRYVTIYANKAHVYMEVAGLRLDTSAVGDPSGKSGVRWRPPIGKRFSFAARHVPGL